METLNFDEMIESFHNGNIAYVVGELNNNKAWKEFIIHTAGSLDSDDTVNIIYVLLNHSKTNNF